MIINLPGRIRYRVSTERRLGTMHIHDQLRLYLTKDAVILEPSYLDPSVLSENLTIDRQDGEIRHNQPALPTMEQEKVMVIHGLFGMIRLFSGYYLIVITERERIGWPLAIHKNGFNSEIWKVKKVQLIPLAKSTSHLSLEQKMAEQDIKNSILDIFKQDSFYFSYGMDLTKAFQRRMELDPNVDVEHLKTIPLWKQADNRFFWNRYLQKPLIAQSEAHPEQDLSAFILPVISGFIEFHKFSSDFKRDCTLGLISRRGSQRIGTRYFSRGIDHDGNVSNFVETEQILAVRLPADYSWKIFSHVQIRGSIPLFWNQIVNTKYKPDLKLFSNTSEEKSVTLRAVSRHFNELQSIYGPVIVWNLVDKKGKELKLAYEMSEQLETLADPKIKYGHFDFHKECKNMRWDRIKILLNDFNKDLQNQSYFVAVTSSSFPSGFEILQKQTSVVRTNCMDCLDRTNVVQSEVAFLMLESQMATADIRRDPNSNISSFKDFNSVFKNIWADNADAISVQYSGTGALKTDFTRTGTRTRQGLLMDGWNSAIRYLKNNYTDGTRQDALDLLLGKADLLSHHPLTRNSQIADQPDKRGLKYVALVSLLAVSVSMLFLTLIFYLLFGNSSGDNSAMVANSSLWSSPLFRMVMWIVVLLADIKLINSDGQKFVNKPKLIDPYLSPMTKLK